MPFPRKTLYMLISIEKLLDQEIKRASGIFYLAAISKRITKTKFKIPLELAFNSGGICEKKKSIIIFEEVIIQICNYRFREI